MRSPGQRRGLVAGAGLLLTIGVVVAVVLVLVNTGSARQHRAAVVHVAAPPPAPPTPPAPVKPEPKPKPRPTDDPWPLYGYNLARTRLFPGGAKLDPPLTVGWRFHDGALLEFPPVIYDNTLYFEDGHGWASALNSTDGRLIWHHRLGTLAAASPALDLRHNLVFFTLLSTTPGAREPGNGSVVAVSMRTGRVAWSHSLPAGSESSPLVHGLSVFLGDQGGTVYSFRTYDGHLNWTVRASGSVKGGVAFAHNTIYFGDYGARVHAVDAGNGRQVWSAGGGDSFYSTPAVAFGRVYIGSTSGAVYAFWANSGAVSWTASTGAYVYASPAVADVPGLGPTVYIGSYDGHLYAYNAETGGTRWSHEGGGRIDGSATVVGNVVYYSRLGSNTTAGLNWRTGAQVFSFPDGEFTPVITDGKVVFLIGYSTIYQMVPKR
ncbi:MAG TPA: PQQ-binding-like beta-propeller repeat protein [Solirubrobacteraceae bacterium]|nr:PQQ-binding-like beta-propeller repeat protein [Solirubrobacteraceae bacterium]